MNTAPIVIDAHVHAGEYLTHFSASFAEQMMAGTGLGPEDLTSPVADLIRDMDEVGVAAAFLLAFDVARVEGFKVPNEFVAALCRRHPGRFVGFASVDAGNPTAAREFDHAVTDLGLRGLKTAPCYVGLSPADKRWYDTYAVARAHDLPVLLHTGFTPAKRADPRFFSPVLVEPVARDFPTVRLILAHLGTPWTTACIDLLARHENLYADLSIFGWYQPIEVVAAALAHARRRGVLDRLLWATDRPFCPMGEFVARMRRLAQDADLWPDGQPLTPTEYAGLMGATAAKVAGAGLVESAVAMARP